MEHFVIFSTEQDGFNQEQVLRHLSKLSREYEKLEKKYLGEKAENKRLREQVKAEME